MVRYTDECQNYPYTISIKRSHQKGKSKDVKIYCEDIFTLDIETTSFFYRDDKIPFMYHKGEDVDFWNKEVNSGALPYIWQFGINDKKYYGRTFPSFKKVLDDLPKDMQVIIWVHNLSFEWHFMDFLHWKKVFAKSSHNPIKASCSEYPNIQFRCSYSLENMSLADWGEALHFPKLVGDLDYNILRTPLTDLNNTELGYAARDIEVVYQGIKQELEVYKSVHKIPLTSTGKIRRVVKEMLMSDNQYVNFIHTLVPETVYQYETSRKIYAGGYTHANRCKVGVVWYNEDGKHGGHYDYTSSYPFEMVTSKVPCTPWAWCEPEIPDINKFEEYAYKMHLRFKNIRCELQNTYIQCSKCTLSKINTQDNGRLLKADMCELWCTEQDYNIIRQVYTWDGEVEVLALWESHKDYLPLKFVEYVLQLFHDKTVLKDVDDKAYARAKAFLNALYGLCVTAILQSDVEWNDSSKKWKVKDLTDDEIYKHLEKIRRFKDHRYFLNYDWGCWISNGSRCRLWNDLIIPYDEHVIYSDTDSIFTDIAIDFTEYNKKLDDKLLKVCNDRGLDYNKTRPANAKGEKSYLGHLTIEPEWTEFKTLGAKRYCERRKDSGTAKEDGKLWLTISGINKGAVTCLNDDINNFKDGCNFDRDEDDVDKLLHTYFDDQPTIKFPDGFVSKQKRGVNLRPNGYKIKINRDYRDFIEDNIRYKNEHFEIYERGVIHA